MLPSSASKDHYIKLRLKRVGQGDNKLRVMSELIGVERKRQKAKERMANTGHCNRMDNKLYLKCHSCRERGHKSC